MDPKRFKQAFFRRVADMGAFEQLLDLLPDVAFFVKDRRSRFVLNNARAVEACGAESEEATLGKLGYEFFAADRMALYLEQDRHVMKTGRPIINALCPAPEKGNEAMILYSKVPVRDRRGRIIGLAGMHRAVRMLEDAPAEFQGAARALRVMQQRYAEPLTIARLATEAGLSRSQLDRQFRRLTGSTPREHLARVRIHAACRLLIETEDKTTQIALRTGFYDHSHFSRTFRRLLGICPTAFRRRHAAQRMLDTRGTRS